MRILMGVVTIIIILAVVGGFGWLLKNISEENEALHREDAQVDICIKENTENIRKFTLDCISSLKVEEAVTSCENSAIRIFCGRNKYYR
jgi:flagellar basal body-associated protein FliL